MSREEQLAWKIAAVATDPVELDEDVVDMVINRIIDNASVAIAAINRTSVANARAQALSHPRDGGACVFGIPGNQRFHAEWAAWANATAVRELDFHDTFLAADYSHPGDNIPAVLAVAQQTKRGGHDLLRGIATGYEIQINLVKGICLHEHKIDHVAHLAPAVAAGIGTMLHMAVEQIYQAINQSLHLACATRQSRKGHITSWKAYAPAQANKIAIEAVGRAVAFAEWTGARLHIAHKSSKDALYILKDAKKRGVDVTVETCPHYLLMTSEDMLRLGGLLRVNPPIREPGHGDALWAALHDGTIDMIATDHAPHLPEEKNGETIWQCDCGIAGVETQMPVMLTQVNAGRLSINQYVQWSAHAPAKAWGCYPNKGVIQAGSDADIVIANLNHRRVIDDAKLHSKSKITAWHGFETTASACLEMRRSSTSARSQNPGRRNFSVA